jgi:two-component system sensor histidine kinase DevS
MSIGSEKTMEAQDLRLAELLDFRPQEGRILFKGSRKLLVDATAMGLLRKELITTLGRELARGLLVRYGFEEGYEDASRLASEYTWNSEDEWLRAGPMMHILQGIVNVEVTDLHFDRAAGSLIMRGIWRNSYEAEEHLRHFGPSPDPVCWTLAGYASGYASAFLGSRAICLETSCVGRGDPVCLWEIRDEAAWRGQAESMLRDLDAPPLARSLIEAYTQQLNSIRQLAALREAILAISTDLTLSEVLQRIVDVARELVNAQYAALGVPDPNGERLAEFVISGLSPAEVARIGSPPRGRGILGVIIREGQSLRLRDVRQDPRFSGFPPHHPIMTSFLGVPIIYRGKRLGNLYLCNKIGAEEFSADDQRIIEMLAAHAAVAIENARLYESVIERGRRLEERNAELAALNAVAYATSQYHDLDQVLREALEAVLAATEVAAGEVHLWNDATQEMVLALHAGQFAEGFHEITRFRRGQGLPGLVAQTGQPVVVTDLKRDPRYLRRKVVEAGFGSYVCIPIAVKGKVIGTLGLAALGRRNFTQRDLELLQAIGSQIGIAIENAQLYRQVQRLAVLEERERIGMDLHDGVIQSIYAVGLTLDYARLLLREGNQAEASRRLEQAIEDLNATIRDIRSYIMDLRPRRFQAESLAEGLHQLAREFKANTLVDVELNITPGADATLGREARLGLFHIAQEALANVAKHARATSVKVNLHSADGQIVLNVQDNGIGMRPEARQARLGHGLANMAERARALGGQFELESEPGKGTCVTVRIPLPMG